MLTMRGDEGAGEKIGGGVGDGTGRTATEAGPTIRPNKAAQAADVANLFKEPPAALESAVKREEVSVTGMKTNFKLNNVSIVYCSVACDGPRKTKNFSRVICSVTRTERLRQCNNAT